MIYPVLKFDQYEFGIEPDVEQLGGGEEKKTSGKTKQERFKDYEEVPEEKGPLKRPLLRKVSSMGLGRKRSVVSEASEIKKDV